MARSAASTLEVRARPHRPRARDLRASLSVGPRRGRRGRRARHRRDRRSSSGGRSGARPRSESTPSSERSESRRRRSGPRARSRSAASSGRPAAPEAATRAPGWSCAQSRASCSSSSRRNYPHGVRVFGVALALVLVPLATAGSYAWEARAPMPLPRTEVVAATVGNEIVVLGGLTLERGASTRVDAYSPARNSWRRLAGPADRRSSLDGRRSRRAGPTCSAATR